MEGWSSHNKRTQTKSIPFHSTSTQIEEKFKDTPSSGDPILLKLQEVVAQAHIALEQC